MGGLGAQPVAPYNGPTFSRTSVNPMPLFDVTYENIAYSERSDLDGQQLIASDLDRLNASWAQDDTRPKHVQQVTGVRLSEDDAQAHREERKIFVCATLRVEATDAEAAEALPIPTRFLRHVVGDFNLARGLSLSPEEGWDATDVEIAPEPTVAAEARVQRRVRPR